MRVLALILLLISRFLYAQEHSMDSFDGVPHKYRDARYYQKLLQTNIDLIKADPAGCKKYFELIHSWATINQHDSLSAASANGLGRAYTYLGHYDSAHVWFDKMLHISKGMGIYDLDNSYLMNRGITYFYEANYDSSSALFSMAYDMARSHHHDQDISRASNNLGLIYLYAGDHENAMHWLLAALEIDEKLGDMPGVAKCYNNIAMIYKTRGDLVMAKKYYMLSLNIKKGLDDQIGMFGAYHNLGNVFRDQGQYDSAYLLLTEAQTIAETLDYPKGIGMVLGSMAVLAHKQQRYQEAENLNYRSLSVADETKDISMLANSLLNLGDAQRMLGKFNEAVMHLDSGLRLSKEIKDADYYEQGLLILSQTHRQMGNYQVALETFQEHVAIKDSVKNLKIDKIVSELQTKYETSKKEHQIAIQQAKLKAQTMTIENNRIAFLLIAISFVLLAVIGILWRNRNRKVQLLKLQRSQLATKRAEISATIASQEKERSRFARDLHDGFGQLISILNLNLRNLNNDLRVEERHEVYQSSSKIIDNMYEELRNICFDLMPQTLVNCGLPQALKEFKDRVNYSGKVRLELNTFGLTGALSDIQEISLYRISQEWVNNILKYSDADRVTLQLTQDEEEITLLIEDNGTGFDKRILESGKGNGWRNLQARANLLHGELLLETTEGVKGNTLIFNTPMKVFTKDMEALKTDRSYSTIDG